MLYRDRQILIPIVLNGSRRKVLVLSTTVVTESFSRRSETYVDLDAFDRRRVAKMEGNTRPRFGVIVSSFFSVSVIVSCGKFQISKFHSNANFQ